MRGTPRSRPQIKGKGESPIESLVERLRLFQEVVDSKKAHDVVLLDMRGCSSEVDGFLVCHGTSQRQVKAIAEAVEEKLAEMGEPPLFIEGLSEGSWVLIDCGDLVLHIFREQTRKFYRLEDLWFHAPRIEPAPSEAASGR